MGAFGAMRDIAQSCMRAIGSVDQMGCLFCGGLGVYAHCGRPITKVGYIIADACGGLCCLAGQVFDRISHNRKAFACVACARGLNRSVDRKDIDLLGNRRDLPIRLDNRLERCVQLGNAVLYASDPGGHVFGRIK